MANLTELPAWKALQEDFAASNTQHMREQFTSDPTRFDRYSMENCGLFLDYSKNRINDSVFHHLIELAEESDLTKLRDAMFNADQINFTEQRAVLHTALRQQSDQNLIVEGKNITPTIHAELARMKSFSDQLQRGEIKGFSGKPIRQLVNIGIGGSHLGPMLVCEALENLHHENLSAHFVSGTDLTPHLEKLDPETTLFIVASKTFTTQETLLNAEMAKDWILDTYSDPAAIANHFVALSTNLDATNAFGIPENRVFAFWDWVGGRYSLWSAVGLVIMLLIGSEQFHQLLSGANAMDQHFRNAAPKENMPVIMGLLGIWYSHFYKAHSHAVIPYDERLRSFPAHLQQLDMESNGKSVDKDGLQVQIETGPIIFGSCGTDCQHAYFQSIHQGTRLIPVDFIAILSAPYLSDFHEMLISHCFAQSEALMRGKTIDEVDTELRIKGKTPKEIELVKPHMVFPGNKPSNTLLLKSLDAHSVGALIALYEHKVFVQGAIWGINSFDQWGVELGKQLAQQIQTDLHSNEVTDHDASTIGLMTHYRANR